jgi:hypothetical protein
LSAQVSYLKLLTIALAGAALVMPATAAAAPGRPALASPAPDANVQGVPAFIWGKVKGADRYEFQLAADPSFGSIVSKGSFQTRNTAASIDRSLPDGEYHWRVRGINAKGDAGRWATRSLTKGWTVRPELLAPADGAGVPFPTTPLLLRWSSVPRAYKYRVYIATDPGLGTLVVKDGSGPISTSGTVYSPAIALAPGRYYWAVEAVDASSHRGARSAVGSFDWSWPSATSTTVSDLIDEPVVMDPHLAWNPVPGAVGYDVEVNYSDDWSVGSKVCCSAITRGTELSPTVILPNNVYNWRVRAIDPDGNYGQWNVGTPFDKHFGNVPPTIQNLRLRDREGDLAAGTATSTPIVVWDPVPGAADYEYQIVPRTLGVCDWTQPDASDVWRNTVTASTAWTPLATYGPGVDPPDPRYTQVGVATDSQPVSGKQYCFRVRARTGNSAVFSDWTQLGGLGAAGFTYTAPPVSGDPLGMATDATYRLPVHGSSTPRSPLFTWNPVAGANSYWVVVAKDAAFTEIFDVAFTRITAYSPRLAKSPETYPDDTTPYYWAVLPSPETIGGNVGTVPAQQSPRSFVKASDAPALITPAGGSDVASQPVFRWSWREGAKDYRLQVAQDPTFGDPLDDVKTQATSFTPTKSYPADTVLYWRVRVTDVKDRGLSWSPTGTFRRRLPIPRHADDNPTGGPTIPALAWLPVQGAESYSIHADQADGTTRDYTLRGTVFTPNIFYGTGVWHWQIRANFPGGSQSGWSAATPFTRTIPPPDGVNAINKDGRLLIGWEPSVMAKKYRVEISASNSFSSIAYSATTENLANAPTLTSSAFLDGGTLYWRVAAIDEGNNVGGFATGEFRTPKRMIVRVSGGVNRTAKSKVIVTATDARGRVVKRAKVKVSGAAHAKAKRTGKKGTATFVLRGRRKGTVTFRVARSGYRTGVATLVVP